MKRAMKLALPCSLLLAIALPALAGPPSTPQQVIGREGRFVFSDGSSYYALEKDGSFHSGPLDVSGRTIEGRWKDESGRFAIEGKWGWINGKSLINDRRRMVIGISGLLAASKTSKPLMPIRRIKGPMVLHSCYFVIEELVRLPK